MEVAGGDAGGADALECLAGGAVVRAPSDDEGFAGGIAAQFRRGEGGGERLNFLAALGVHLRVQLGAARGVAELVVLEARDHRVLPGGDAGAGRRVAGLAVERVRLEVGRPLRAVRPRGDHQRLQVGLVEGLDAGGECLVGEQEHGGRVRAGDADGLHREVEAVLDVLRGQDDARSVAVAAVDRLHQVGLLDVGGHPRGGAAALHVDNHDRHLGHRGPAEGLHLKREAGAGTAGDGDVTGVGEAERGGDGGDLILALHEDAAVLRQLGAEGLHNARPRGDRVTGAVADAGGEEPVGDGRVAIEGDLRSARDGGGAVDGLEAVEEVAQVVLRPGVARVEGEQRVAHDVLVLTAETLADQLGELRHLEVEDARDQPEHVDVLALVLRGAADRLDGAGGDRAGDVGEPIVALDGLHVIRIVEQHATRPQGADVRVVAVLVKRDQHIRPVAGREDVPGAHPHLEDRGSPGDRRGDGHIRHHVLVAAASEAGEKAADRLNPILGIAGEADDDVLDGAGGSGGAGAARGFGSIRTDHEAATVVAPKC